MMQRWAASVGIAFLLLMQPIMELVQSQSLVRYHSMTPLRPLVGMLLLDLAALTVLIVLIVTLGKKVRGWAWVQLLLAAWLPFLLLRKVLLFTPHAMPERLFELCVLIVFAGLVLLRRQQPATYHLTLRTGTAILACLGISSVFMCAQLLRIAAWQPEPAATAAPPTLAKHTSPHPRVVWVVLDELSYDQAFEHREAGLSLPALDADRRQSVVYTDVAPVGDKTDRVLPSLLLGQEVTDIHYSWTNRLYVQHPESSDWLPFNAGTTLFGVAHRKGWHTGVVGWYNPYCSILAPYLDSCFSANEDMDKPAWYLPTDVAMPRGVAAGLELLLGARGGRNLIVMKDAWAREHTRSYEEIFDRAQAMASDDRLDLVLLHLPVPHFPNIYDRRSGRFVQRNSSYADNLALTDRALGALMAQLKASPRWSETTLIVCGDHSWRASWWRPYAQWTAEDEMLSGGGQFDPRPALLIHFPGQTRSIVDPEAISLLEVHRLMDQIIRTGEASPSLVTVPDADAQGGSPLQAHRQP